MRVLGLRSEGGRPSLRLLSRAGCHLCERLHAVAKRAVEEAGGTLTVVDVDSDPTLAARWGEEIPILLYENGRVLARALDTEPKIRRRLGLGPAHRASLGAERPSIPAGTAGTRALDVPRKPEHNPSPPRAGVVQR